MRSFYQFLEQGVGRLFRSNRPVIKPLCGRIEPPQPWGRNSVILQKPLMKEIFGITNTGETDIVITYPEHHVIRPGQCHITRGSVQAEVLPCAHGTTRFVISAPDEPQPSSGGCAGGESRAIGSELI